MSVPTYLAHIPHLPFACKNEAASVMGVLGKLLGLSSTTRSRSAPSSKTAQPLGAREPGGPGGTAGGTTRGDTVSLCTEDRDLGLAEDTSHGTRTAYTTATVRVLDQPPSPCQPRKDRAARATTHEGGSLARVTHISPESHFSSPSPHTREYGHSPTLPAPRTRPLTPAEARSNPTATPRSSS